MKRFGYAPVLALVSVGVALLAGCKPDAAVQRGAVVGAGPKAAEQTTKPFSRPVVIRPESDNKPPLNAPKVQ